MSAVELGQDDIEIIVTALGRWAKNLSHDGYTHQIVSRLGDRLEAHYDAENESDVIPFESAL